jgi:very-short-patch-repair endonuclease
VNGDLRSLLARHGGVVTRAQALAAVPRWVLEHAVRTGDLVRLLPQVYVDGARQQDPSVRRRAAVAFGGPRSALSHTSALAVWDLHRPAADEPVHLTVPADLRLRSASGVVVHRRSGPLSVRFRGGLPVLRLEASLVDSWPVLPAGNRRAPVIEAVGRRLTTPDRLRGALTAAPRLPGRRELLDLLDKLDAGCRSALEIWGLVHIFTGPGMPAFERQHPVQLGGVQLGGRTVYLDVYATAERVDFELDGDAWHGSPGQRERDLRRDAALAARGIAVVRFSYRRLVSEPDQVRREVLAARHSMINARSA